MATTSFQFHHPPSTPKARATQYSPKNINIPMSPRTPRPVKIVVNPYDDFKVVKRLNEARFPVYLAKSNVTRKPFVIKVFPYVKNGATPSPHYNNELRFSTLSH